MSMVQQQLQRAIEITNRYRLRGNELPHELIKAKRVDPEKLQEYRDACKLKAWKYSIAGKNRHYCPDEVRDYLDENMPGWRDRVYSHDGQSSRRQMEKAKDIVKRYSERGCVLPKRRADPSKLEETRDAICLSTWKSALYGRNSTTCPQDLCHYLDGNLPGWRGQHHGDSKANSDNDNRKAIKPLIASKLEKQEHSSSSIPYYMNPTQVEDGRWMQFERHHPEVLKYLDMDIPKRRICELSKSHTPSTSTIEPTALAQDIVMRCNMRHGLLPRLIPLQDQVSADLVVENSDALTLLGWKRSHVTNPDSISPELHEYLNTTITNWQNIKIPADLDEEGLESNCTLDRSDERINKRQKRDDNLGFPRGTNSTEMISKPIAAGKDIRSFPQQNIQSSTSIYQHNSGSPAGHNHTIISSKPPQWCSYDTKEAVSVLTSNCDTMFTSQNAYAYRPSTYNNGPAFQRNSLARQSTPNILCIPPDLNCD